MKKIIVYGLLLGSLSCDSMEVDDVINKKKKAQYVVLDTSDGKRITTPLAMAEKFSALAYIIQDYDNENGMVIPLDRVDSDSIFALAELLGFKRKATGKSKNDSSKQQNVSTLQKTALAAHYLGLEDTNIFKTVDRLIERLIRKDSLLQFEKGNLNIKDLEELRFPFMATRLKQLLKEAWAIKPEINNEGYHPEFLLQGVSTQLRAIKTYHYYKGSDRDRGTKKIEDRWIIAFRGIPHRNYYFCRIEDITYSRFPGHNHINDIALSSDNRYLATLHSYGKFKIWRVLLDRTTVLERTFSGYYGLGKMVWSPTRLELAYNAFHSSRIAIIRPSNGRKRFVNCSSRVIRFKWSPCGHYLLVLHGTNPRYRLSIFDSQTGDDLVDLSSSKCSIFEWSPDSSRIAFSVGQNVYIVDWKTRSSYKLKHINKHSTGFQLFTNFQLRKITWAPNGKHMIVSFEDGSNCVWDVESKQLICSLDKFDKHKLFSFHDDRDILWLEKSGTLIKRCPCNSKKWELHKQDSLLTSIMSMPLDHVLFCYYALAYPAHALALLERKDSALNHFFDAMPEEIQSRLEAVNATLSGRARKTAARMSNCLINAVSSYRSS